jgi:predicted RecB family nuclease
MAVDRWRRPRNGLDGARLKILDPWTGVQYVDNDINAYTSYASTGTLLWVISSQ